MPEMDLINVMLSFILGHKGAKKTLKSKLSNNCTFAA